MQNIVILGGGTAGWMAANLFHHLLPADKVTVTLVESPEVGIIGVGEGSTPTLKRFFDMLGIKESEWMPECNATYKANIQFTGWSPQSGITSYSHPFISQVDTFTERAFYTNCRTRRLGLDTHTLPDSFLLNGVLAQKGLAPITPEHFPFRMEYGYHFDSHLLGAFLAKRAVSKGVTHYQTRATTVDQHVDGSIASLRCDNGEVINGDWFVDCSGFAAVLLEKTLGVPFESFGDNLFNNAAVVLPTSMENDIPVQTESVAMACGWRWKIPLTHRFGNGYVYADGYLKKDDAETELRRELGLLDADVEARHLKMRVGQRAQHWCKNCIGLGLSQGFIEPLEATALHLVQICIEMFADYLLKGQFTNQFAKEYNQRVRERFDRVRDYIVAHYKLNTRHDSDYWRDNRNNPHFSDSLGQLLDVWFKREVLEQEIERQQLASHFGATSWHCLLSGYGAYPALAPNQPGKGDLYKDQDIARFMQGCALNFPSHHNALQQLMPPK